jgi:hypothetical protein
VEEKVTRLKPTYGKFNILGLLQTFTAILPALVPELLCLEPKASSSANRCICAYFVFTLVKKPVYFPICVHSDVDVWGLDIIADSLLHQLYNFHLRNNKKIDTDIHFFYFQILGAVQITRLRKKTQ